jgi:transposase
MQVYGSILPGAAALARLLPRAGRRDARQLGAFSRCQGRLSFIRWHAEHGRNVTKTAEHFGYIRPTVYPWLNCFQRAGVQALKDRSQRPHKLRQHTWLAGLEQRVLELREQYPRWGKDKLVVLLRRECFLVSTSMVGRILKRLKEKDQLIEPLPERRRRRKDRRPRPYAIRKPRGYFARALGDIVEIGTVDLRPLPGVILKHFTAHDVVSRWDVLASTHAQLPTPRPFSSMSSKHAHSFPCESHPGRRWLRVQS